MRYWRHRRELGLLASILTTLTTWSACATAPTPSNNEDPDAAVIETPDSSPPPPQIDAAPVPVQVTLSQTTSNTVIQDTGVRCSNSTGTAEESWYRVFNLANLGITSTLTTEKVTMGIELVDANGGNIPVDVKLHTLMGSFVVANLTEIAATQVSLADQNLTVVDVPLVADIPVGSILVAEVHVASLTNTGTGVVIGANNLGQTDQGYIRSPTCDFNEPVTMAAINFPDSHIVLSVTGTY